MRGPQEPLDWRIERYESLGFDHVQAVELANEKDARGVFIYWGDVEAVLARSGDHALVVRVFCGSEALIPATLPA